MQKQYKEKTKINKRQCPVSPVQVQDPQRQSPNGTGKITCHSAFCVILWFHL